MKKRVLSVLSVVLLASCLFGCQQTRTIPLDAGLPETCARQGLLPWVWNRPPLFAPVFKSSGQTPIEVAQDAVKLYFAYRKSLAMSPMQRCATTELENIWWHAGDMDEFMVSFQSAATGVYPENFLYGANGECDADFRWHGVYLEMRIVRREDGTYAVLGVGTGGYAHDLKQVQPNADALNKQALLKDYLLRTVDLGQYEPYFALDFSGYLWMQNKLFYVFYPNVDIQVPGMEPFYGISTDGQYVSHVYEVHPIQ